MAAKAGIPAEISVIDAELVHLAGLAETHVAAFPGEFLTLLGSGVLHAFYGHYIEQPGGICLVAAEQRTGQPCGFVCGGDPALRARFTRRHCCKLAWAAFRGSLLHSHVRRRLRDHLCQALRRIAGRLHLFGAEGKTPSPPEDPPGTWSSLLSVCAHPDFRGRGVGKALMEAFRAESDRRGYQSMRLSVHNDNQAAIALYKKTGWQAIMTSPKGTYFRRPVQEPR